MSTNLYVSKVGRLAPPDEPRWSVEDVAGFLRVPVETIYRWRKTHYGPPASRVGRYLRFDPDEVRAWFRAQREQAA